MSESFLVDIGGVTPQQLNALRQARAGDVVPISSYAALNLITGPAVLSPHPKTDAYHRSTDRWTSRYVCAYCDHGVEYGHQCRNCGAREPG